MSGLLVGLEISMIRRVLVRLIVKGIEGGRFSRT
jgi:hypothetical protein